jgi:transcriptional regulator with XRE-family HTH domain
MPGFKKKSVGGGKSVIVPNQPERHLGRRVKQLREALGLNFEQLAALTREYDPEGIAPVTLRRYERDDESATLPGLRELRILCEALEVSADYLLLEVTPSEADKRDRDDWEHIKGVIRRVINEESVPSMFAKKDPYRTMERQEKLQRARLHTKLKDEKGES